MSVRVCECVSCECIFCFSPALRQCPTLVLRGEYDTASLCADADGLMATLTCQKQRIDIADATHYGILEQSAERFFEAITDFIEGDYPL